MIKRHSLLRVTRYKNLHRIIFSHVVKEQKTQKMNPRSNSGVAHFILICLNFSTLFDFCIYHSQLASPCFLLLTYFHFVILLLMVNLSSCLSFIIMCFRSCPFFHQYNIVCICYAVAIDTESSYDLEVL